jgi:hypothetical protein
MANGDDMKISLVVPPLLFAIPLVAASKPRIFIPESGAIQITGPSMALTGPASSENIEVMGAFQKHCPGVTVTGDKDKADFVIRLDRESPSPHHAIRSRQQSSGVQSRSRPRLHQFQPTAHTRRQRRLHRRPRS